MQTSRDHPADKVLSDRGIAGALAGRANMSRRTLLLLVVVVVGVLLVLYLLFGRGSSQGAPPPTPTPRMRNGHLVPSPTPIPKQVRAIRSFAAHVVPVVDRSLRKFRRIAGSASSAPNMSALSAICTRAVKRVGVQQDLLDGVPHPYAWYTPAGRMHHYILGIYHDMLGSAIACQTDAGNNDYGNAPGAVAGLRRAAQTLGRVDGRLHRLAAKPH